MKYQHLCHQKDALNAIKVRPIMVNPPEQGNQVTEAFMDSC